jgi:hypothetical protein
VLVFNPDMQDDYEAGLYAFLGTLLARFLASFRKPTNLQGILKPFPKLLGHLMTPREEPRTKIGLEI